MKEEARASKGRQAFRCERLYSVSRVIRVPKTMASNINSLAGKFLLASGESCSGESRKKEVIFWRGLRSLESTAKRLFVFPSIFLLLQGSSMYASTLVYIIPIKCTYIRSEEGKKIKTRKGKK